MDWQSLLLNHWPVKLVSLVLIWAYVIDARGLRVPNWITFPLAFTGIAFHCSMSGWDGLAYAMLGLAAGLGTLLPLYMIGGMGAGDVKLMAGAGAWVGMSLIISSFIAIAIVGGIMGVVMAILSGRTMHHVRMCGTILRDIVTLRSPTKIFEAALDRKESMTLVPYGIPVCIGAITTFIHYDVLF